MDDKELRKKNEQRLVQRLTNKAELNPVKALPAADVSKVLKEALQLQDAHVYAWLETDALLHRLTGGTHGRD